MKKTISKLDLFALPFRFPIGKQNDKSKRTLFGGWVSIFVIVLSILYFAYICYQYLENKIQPSINNQDIYARQRFTHNIKSGFTRIRLQLEDGRTLAQLHSTTNGVIYIHIAAIYYYMDSDGESQSISALGTTCEEEDWEDYLCFNLNQTNKSGVDLVLAPDSIEYGMLSLFVAKCSPLQLKSGESCISDQTLLEATVLRPTTVVTVAVILDQFNAETKEFETKTKLENYSLDSALSFSSIFSLIKTDVNIIDGFITQSKSETSIIENYSRSDVALSQISVNASLGFYIYGMARFQLTENNKKITVQYPPFTQLLAMFSSVFNSLLAVGIICKIFASIEMSKDLVSVQLQVYYKKTAAKLVEESNLVPPANSTDQAGNQLGLYSTIQNFQLAEQVRTKSKFGVLKRLLFFMSTPTSDVGKKNKDAKEVQLYERLHEQSVKSMDINQVKKDILEMKMFLRMMLTPQQWAALQLCGSSISFPQEQHTIKRVGSGSAKVHAVSVEEINDNANPNSNTPPQVKDKKLTMTTSPDRDTNGQEKSNEKRAIINSEVNRNLLEKQSIRNELYPSNELNHLETIDKIQEDFATFKEYFTRFIKTSINSKSELDRRINNCLIQTQPTSVVVMGNLD